MAIFSVFGGNKEKTGGILSEFFIFPLAIRKNLWYNIINKESTGGNPNGSGYSTGADTLSKT